MPNKHAAIKDLRKNKSRAARNARIATNIKALTRQFKDAVKEKKTKDVAEIAKKMQQALDKAAKHHVLHKNKVSRRISSAHRAINKKA